MKVYELIPAYEQYKKSGFVCVRINDWATYKDSRKKKFMPYKITDVADGVVKIERKIEDVKTD